MSMAKIKVISKCELYDGMSITFKAPCEGTAVDGLNVYYNNFAQSFTLRDAHGNNLANLNNLFSEGAYIKAILDTGNGNAYLQNADSSGYLEQNLARVRNISSEYVWQKTKTEAQLVIASEETMPFLNAQYADYIKLTVYGTAVANLDGTVTLSNPVSYSLNAYTDNSVLLNKYYDYNGSIYLLTSYSFPSYEERVYLNGKIVSAESVTKSFGYLNSHDPTAYPPVLGIEYVMDTPSYSSIQVAMVVLDAFTVSYYESIDINQSDGSFTPAGKLQTVSATYNTRTVLNVLAGKYVLLNDTLYYCSPDAPYSVTTNNWYYFYLNLWPVSTVLHKIYDDEYTYNLRGQIGGAAQIVTGSYVGTGTVGTEKPCILRLGFVPQIVIVHSDGFPERGSYGWKPGGFVWVNPCEKDRIEYNANSDPYKYIFDATAEEFKFSLGSTADTNYSNTLGGLAPAYQCNEARKKYYYIAIG